MEEQEKLRQMIGALERRAEALERRYEKLIGKADEFVPRTNAIMREGVPLEIFSRLSLINSGFEVHGEYQFLYRNMDGADIDRSVDIYAVMDSIYTVPEGKSRNSGESWPERSHLLVEVKQRRAGVEWVFSRKPTTDDGYPFFLTDRVPRVNTGFEIRPNEGGMSSNANPKDVNNAIAQLNQAYMPFQVGLFKKEEIKRPGMSKQYAAHHGREDTFLLLITNAKLKVFRPPAVFGDIMSPQSSEDDLFHEEPWVLFEPERSIPLIIHQKHVVRKVLPSEPDIRNLDKPNMLGFLADYSHEVHIVNFDRVDEFFAMVKDPPRIESINFNIKVEGADEIIKINI